MPSTRSRGEPILPLDPGLNRTLDRMNDQQNPANLVDRINRWLPQPVNVHNQEIMENPGDGALRRKPPVPRPQEFYRANINITDSDWPLVLPPLPQGHTFVVTSSSM